MSNNKSNSAASIGWYLSRLEGILMVLLTMALVVNVVLGILSRYLPFDVAFATELAKYTFIWLGAIGISTAAKDNQHVRLTAVVEILPIARRITWIISQFLFLLFSGFLLYWGTQLTLMHWTMDKSAMGFEFPMFIFTAAIPVGMALTSIRLIQNLWQCFGSAREGFQPWESQSEGLAGINLPKSNPPGQ